MTQAQAREHMLTKVIEKFGFEDDRVILFAQRCEAYEDSDTANEAILTEYIELLEANISEEEWKILLLFFKKSIDNEKFLWYNIDKIRDKEGWKIMMNRMTIKERLFDIAVEIKEITDKEHMTIDDINRMNELIQESSRLQK